MQKATFLAFGEGNWLGLGKRIKPSPGFFDLF
jgi:hypothetical protein